MASLRSLVLLVWIFSQAILVLSQKDSNCASLFSSNKASITGFDNLVTVEIQVDELTSEGEIIYDLTWTECVEPPLINDDNFNEYFTANDTTKCTWEISVNSELTGLPDYPSPQSSISTQVNFGDFTTISIKTCQVTLSHTIDDANTQYPEPDSMNYIENINEDFMPGYTISNFKTSVHDQDGTSPNNQFTVTIDDDCPLEATKNSYTSGSSAVNVNYRLKKSLDYEKMKQIECQVTFQISSSRSQCLFHLSCHNSGAQREYC